MHGLFSIPRELLFIIFSKFSTKELTKISIVNKQFNNICNDITLDLYKFKEARKKIETNPNYKPDIDHKSLLNLVRDANGKAIHETTKNALAIQPSEIKTSLGKFYQLKFATEEQVYEDGIFEWHVNCELLLLVKNDGGLSIHYKHEVNENNYKPVEHITPDYILNYKCLHKQEPSTFKNVK